MRPSRPGRGTSLPRTHMGRRAMRMRAHRSRHQASGTNKGWRAVILNDLRNLRLRLIVRGAVVIERQWTRERDGRHGLVRMLWPMYDAAVDARHAGDPWQIEMSEQD